MDPTEPTTEQPWAPVLPTAHLGEALRIRELPPDEWHRLQEAGGFFEVGERIPAPTRHVKVIALEALHPPDRPPGWWVVGYWPVFDAVHAEPLFIREGYRSNRQVVSAMLGALITLLQNAGVEHVWATIAHGHVTSEQMAEKIGMVPLEGSTWTCKVPKGGQ